MILRQAMRYAEATRRSELHIVDAHIGLARYAAEVSLAPR